MRVKVIVDSQPILNKKTGIGWYTYNIINKMLSLNDDNLQLESTSFDFLMRNKSENTIKKIGFYNYKIWNLFPARLYKLIWGIIPLRYEYLFGKADIYHFFNYIVPPIKSGKIITTIHDLAYILYPETLKKSNLYMLKIHMKNTIKKADIIVVVSESTKQDVVKLLGVSEERIRVIPNAVDYDFFVNGRNIDASTKEQVRNKYKLSNKYLLYLGTIEPRKNIENIFKAYADLPDSIKSEYKLVIAGGKGWGYERILELPEKLGIQDNIIYTGYVDEEDKPYIYGLAEMFLFPSLYEGFGIPILEAMTVEVPVITSNTSSMPEVSGEAALYVNPVAHEDLKDKIMMLLSNKKLRTKLIKLGVERAKKYSWEESARMTLELYKEVLKVK